MAATLPHTNLADQIIDFRTRDADSRAAKTEGEAEPNAPQADDTANPAGDTESGN